MISTRFNWDSDSALLDKELGFKIEAIEMELLHKAKVLRPSGNHHTWGEGIHDGNQSWVGLDPQTLQTPYAELKQICELVKPTAGNLVLDLGAGYGRLGIVLNDLCPESNFLGYELVGERVTEANRVYQEMDLKRARMLQLDLTNADFELPAADIYFIYDYGKPVHIQKTLEQLSQMADHQKFKVVARGSGTRSLIENYHPWLFDLNPVIHQEKFSIYSWN